MMNGSEMVECMNGMGMMGFPMGWLMGLVWILLISLVIWGLFRLFKSSDPPFSSEESPLDTLPRRYAEGEISTEEYEERRTVLIS